MKKNLKFILQGSFFAISLILLSGCKGLFDKTSKKKVEKPIHQKKVQSSGVVLCSINGETVIRESDFNKNINQMLQTNPYFKGAGPNSLPLAIKRKFFEELVKQELILADATTQNIYSDPKFIENYEKMVELVKRSLAVQFFEKKIYNTIDISNDEVKKHYNKNKEHFIKVAGGVLVSGAQFSSNADADELLNKVKTKPDSFEAIAKKDANAKLKNFGRISKNAKGFNVGAVPAPIKETAFALKNLPAIEKVKVGKEVWIIAITDKKETIYFDLSEIKPQIEGMIKNNKFRKQLDSKLKKLRSSMTVDINEEYFKEATKPKTVASVDNTKKMKKNTNISAAA